MVQDCETPTCFSPARWNGVWVFEPGVGSEVVLNEATNGTRGDDGYRAFGVLCHQPLRLFHGRASELRHRWCFMDYRIGSVNLQCSHILVLAWKQQACELNDWSRRTVAALQSFDGNVKSWFG